MLPAHVLVAQNLGSILQRLRPTDDRRVLRADAAARRQHARTLATRQIEHDADVATFADAARAHHRRGQRIFDRQPERQHQRPRAVVHTDAVACTRQHLTEQRLRDVVTARGELVEDLALRQQLRLFQLIQGTRNQHRVDDALPIELGRGDWGAASVRGRLEGSVQSWVGSLAGRNRQNSTNRAWSAVPDW